MVMLQRSTKLMTPINKEQKSKSLLEEIIEAIPNMTVLSRDKAREEKPRIGKFNNSKDLLAAVEKLSRNNSVRLLPDFNKVEINISIDNQMHEYDKTKVRIVKPEEEIPCVSFKVQPKSILAVTEAEYVAFTKKVYKSLRAREKLPHPFALVAVEDGCELCFMTSMTQCEDDIAMLDAVIDGLKTADKNDDYDINCCLGSLLPARDFKLSYSCMAEEHYGLIEFDPSMPLVERVKFEKLAAYGNRR